MMMTLHRYVYRALWTTCLALSATGAAFAQADRAGDTTREAAPVADRGFDFNPGWLGLIGLAGLAGLMGKTNESHVHRGTTATAAR